MLASGLCLIIHQPLQLGRLAPALQQAQEQCSKGAGRDPTLPLCVCPHAPKSLAQVNKLEITSDKKLIAAAGNSHIKLFDVNSNSPQETFLYEGHQGNVTAVGFQKDNRWMYTGVRVCVFWLFVLLCSGPATGAACSCHALKCQASQRKYEYAWHCICAP